MPEFRVIKGGADSKSRRKSVAGSKRVTEEQKKAANAAWSPDASASGSVFAHEDDPLANGADPVAGDVSAAQGEHPAKETSATAGSTRRRRVASGKSPAAKALTAFAIAACALLVVLLCSFAAYRWLYGNDGQDIQGSWYVNESTATMSFTESEIILNDEVSYGYALNGADKTISFSFSDLTGSGSYRFSLDRNTLAIFDGDASAFDTLKADFTWFLGALVCAMKGEDPSPVPADAESVTLLTRVVEEPATDNLDPAGTEAELADADADASAQDDAAADVDVAGDDSGDQSTEGADNAEGSQADAAVGGTASKDTADNGASGGADAAGESPASGGSGSDLSFGGAVSDHV